MGSNHRGHEQGHGVRIVFCQLVGGAFHLHVVIVQKVEQDLFIYLFLPHIILSIITILSKIFSAGLKSQKTLNLWTAA